MTKLNLSRRQFINVTAASSGLYAMTGASNLVLGETPQDVGLKNARILTNNDIPYIGMTDEGPFYPPVEIPWLKDFTAVGGADKKPDGQIMYLFGRILDSTGRPIEAATVEVWHADNSGRYRHPRAPEQDRLDSNFGYFGKVKTAKDGTYLFKTIVPRWYNLLDLKRANHVHLKMRHKDHGVLTTQMYFEGKEQDDIREQDTVFKAHPNHDRLIVPKQKPEKFAELDVQFEEDAVCCKYDLAFLF
jgi:protocatechuate 3,4-dioxygenase beta subunit